jgi:hypothetical protein
MEIATKILVCQTVYRNAYHSDMVVKASDACILMFLHISRMVLSSGLATHQSLADSMQCLWRFMDATAPQHNKYVQKSHSNCSNKTSLMSITHIPKVHLLEDEAPTYCSVAEVLGSLACFGKPQGFLVFHQTIRSC